MNVKTQAECTSKEIAKLITISALLDEVHITTANLYYGGAVVFSFIAISHRNIFNAGYGRTNIWEDYQ